MKNYVWETYEEVSNLEELFCLGRIIIPETIFEKVKSLDLDKILPNPPKNGVIHLKYIDWHIDEDLDFYHDSEYYIEEGNETIILYIIFEYGWGSTKVSIVNALSLENGNVEIIKSNEPIKQIFDEWIESVKEWKKEHEEAEDTMDVIRKRDVRKKLWNEVKIEVKVEKPKYVGETNNINMSENMTIEEFAAQYINIYHAIPKFFDEQDRPISKKQKLSVLGVKGDLVVRIPVCFKTFSQVCTEIREQAHISEEIGFSTFYMKRAWAIMDSDTEISNVDQLPSIWHSIGWVILEKIYPCVNWIINKIDSHEDEHGYK